MNLMRDTEQSIQIIRAMAKVIMTERDYLSSLDSTVGDGDHGHNLAKAMKTAVEAIEALEEPTVNEIWRVTGKNVQDSVGGASGLLFGAFFTGAGRAIKGKSEIGLTEVVDMVSGGLAQVQKRGKAQPGDKTMVDALAPAAEAAQQAAEANLSVAETLSQIANAAQTGAEATQEMVAKHGRAKFLGERSIGYQDAGATSMALMLAAWADVIVGETV